METSPQATDEHTNGASATEDAASRDRLKADDATRHFLPDAPSDVVTLVGYLADGETEQLHRLYKDLAHRVWIDIDGNDIIGRFSVEGEDNLTAGQSVIWVRRDANLVMCESLRASIYDTPPRDLTDPRAVATLEWPRH